MGVHSFVEVTVWSLTYDDLLQVKLTYTCAVHLLELIFLSEMSTVSGNDLNLKLWYAVWDGDYDAVVAAIAAGVDVNWKNDSYVSDNDI